MIWWVLLAAGVALVCVVALVAWVRRMQRDVNTWLEKVQRGECTCTRHRLCHVCIAEMWKERAA